VKVICSDCYGCRSRSAEFNFKIYLPSPTNILKVILQYVLLALLAYLVFFPSLIALYPRVKAARTLVKTGWFNKFPLLHYIIINSSWARWRLFCKFVKEQPLPGHYVSQTIFPGYAPNPDPKAEISFKEGKFDESFAGLFKNQRHVMILGRNGSGKTVLIRYLYNKVAATCKKRKTEFPIIIDICSSDIDNFSIEDIIYDTLCGQGIELPQKLINLLLMKGGFIIFIDSLDTKQKETVRDKINSFLNRNLHLKNKILMASQFDLLKRDDVNLFTVNEFIDEQARGLLSDTVGEDYWEELPAELKVLTRKPQDLEFVGKVLKNISPQKVSKHKTEFYKGLLQRDNVLKPWLEAGSNKLDIIYKLSYKMLKEARNPLPEDILREWIKKLLEEQHIVNKDDLDDIIRALDRSSLFKKVGVKGELDLSFDRKVDFISELTGKYLAAQYIRLCIERGDAHISNDIETLSGEPGWFDVFCFVINELNHGPGLNELLNNFIKLCSETHLKLVAYAIEVKGEERIRGDIVDSYKAKRTIDLK
jgi:hypothetical protein